ncbi:MAG: acyl carrier protein [Solobacterium sp.]|jgi:acyl carrier protein|nr:acyl carrier protein [Solobacterium sp.]MCH4049757.1 acyl carrier protein [Solobacterium sp.]MCH4073442.1 acyl carrier protein [Solobacterium sp.]MCI1313418.1 acyl carrier protein [Solobacterium sp.]MCI1345678.1 acyl carrier protein [Solobacterium sp.]
MDELIALLEDINDEADFRNSKDLIDGHEVDSLTVLEIIAALDEHYDISIPASEIVPENFNSAEAMLKMINRLRSE